MHKSDLLSRRQALSALACPTALVATGVALAPLSAEPSDADAALIDLGRKLDAAIAAWHAFRPTYDDAAEAISAGMLDPETCEVRSPPVRRTGYFDESACLVSREGDPKALLCRRCDRSTGRFTRNARHLMLFRHRAWGYSSHRSAPAGVRYGHRRQYRRHRTFVRAKPFSGTSSCQWPGRCYCRSES